ncbi:hypothetical protein [Niabella hibiscisoli]|nr:hypothetical protein [Niabella hibiscisoli]MCH5716790.1 hypothetical protein [Niabella hibiscisoli]
MTVLVTGISGLLGTNLVLLLLEMGYHVKGLPVISATCLLERIPGWH